MINILQGIVKAAAVQTVVQNIKPPKIKKATIQKTLKVTNKILNSAVNLVDMAAFGVVRIISGVAHGVVDVVTLQVLNDDKKPDTDTEDNQDINYSEYTNDYPEYKEIDDQQQK